MILKKSATLPIFKWLSLYAYRSYLGNVFVFQMLLLVFKDTWLRLPTGFMIIVAYCCTATCAFLLSYLLHISWVGVKG